MESRVPSDTLDLQAAARVVALRLGSPRAALNEGYVRLRPMRRVPALNPIAGEHWFNPRYLRQPHLDPAHPPYLMYYPLAGHERLVGVGYALVQPSGAERPAGYGALDAGWHLHHPCSGLPAMGSMLLESAAECIRLGGKPAQTQIAMGHVWLEPQNPEGAFALANFALPFVAAGLTAPVATDLADPVRGPHLRALALALGEAIGARPRLGILIEFGPDSARFRARAAGPRQELQALAESLWVNAQRDDSLGYERHASRMLEVSGVLWQVYLSVAGPGVLGAVLAGWIHDVAGGHAIH